MIKVTIMMALMPALSLARPKFLEIPLTDFQVISLSEQSLRLPRQAWGESPATPLDQASQGDGRIERQAHEHHEHVDYGAHTGHHGAFGWYADFPVKSYH